MAYSAALPTCYPDGVSTSPLYETLGTYPFPDPFNTASNSNLGTATYWTDFMTTSQNTDWTIANGTIALSSTILGGSSVITPTGAGQNTFYKTGPFLQFAQGQKFWYVTQVQYSLVQSATQTIQVGVSKGVSIVDGLWFYKAAGSTTLSLMSNPNNTGAQILVADVLTPAGLATAMATATNYNLGFMYDGTDLNVFVNNLQVARVAAPAIGSTSAAQLSNSILTPMFAYLSVGTETSTLNHVLASCELPAR